MMRGSLYTIAFDRSMLKFTASLPLLMILIDFDSIVYTLIGIITSYYKIFVLLLAIW